MSVNRGSWAGGRYRTRTPSNPQVRGVARSTLGPLRVPRRSSEQSGDPVRTPIGPLACVGMTTPVASAGWYAAPDGEPYERWWDGQAWGQQTRPVPAAQPFPTKAVTYQPVRTSHTFHLIMTILTCGVWGLLVWLPITVVHSVTRRRVVTRYR